MRLRTLLLTVALTAAAAAWAGNIRTRMYLYGFVSSFGDSTVYFTGIQITDSAWMDKKTKFLYSRDNYSYQLRDYMRGRGVENPTCVTFYAPKQKDIEKKYTALKKRYEKGGVYTIKYIEPSEFQYKAITPDESEIDNPNSKDKKKEKKEKKRDRTPPNMGKGGPTPGGGRPQGPPMR